MESWKEPYEEDYPSMRVSVLMFGRVGFGFPLKWIEYGVYGEFIIMDPKP